MNKKVLQLLFCLTLTITIQSCSKNESLEMCWQKQVQPVRESLLEFSFKEKRNELGHNFEPWEQSKYSVIGKVWIGNNKYLKLDTLITSRRSKFLSKTDYSNGLLLNQDYGEDVVNSFSEDLIFRELIMSARYSPLYMIEYFKNNKSLVFREIKGETTVYSLSDKDFLVTMEINNKNFLVTKITYSYHHELYGDTTTTYIFSNYQELSNSTWCPSQVDIEKINGKLLDKVTLETVQISNNKELKLLDKSNKHKIKEQKKPKIKVKQYNDFIHFVELQHTDDRAMVVEFDKFLLVAEAPLNSENGELIITEAKKIAPRKPIKYFVFGHHHPHYLGGLRAFVHKEATIICTEISKEYVEYIKKAPYTFKPDSLQLNPKSLKTEIVKDKISIGENDKMIIYFIGEKSKHTKDYLIYYFPDEKLLFQDDLCWIPKEGKIGKARDRQAGLYQAIKELDIDIDTIIQSWPVKDYGVKTIIPFGDLESSMREKE